MNVTIHVRGRSLFDFPGGFSFFAHLLVDLPFILSVLERRVGGRPRMREVGGREVEGLIGAEGMVARRLFDMCPCPPHDHLYWTSA